MSDEETINPTDTTDSDVPYIPELDTVWLGDIRAQLNRFTTVFLSAVAVFAAQGLLRGDVLDQAFLKAAVAAGIGAVVAALKAAQEQTEGRPARALLLAVKGRGGRLNAAQRGWGNPGRPGSLAGRLYARNMVTVRVQGIKLTVHKRVAPIIADLCNHLAALGIDLDKVADDWAYAHRDIRGRAGVLSNHSWGLAIDVNATTNPMSPTLKTDMPVEKVRALMARYRGLIRWGGDYTGRKDAMHFEFIGTPVECDMLIRDLKLVA